jgi:hypothetical protein
VVAGADFSLNGSGAEADGEVVEGVVVEGVVVEGVVVEGVVVGEAGWESGGESDVDGGADRGSASTGHGPSASSANRGPESGAGVVVTRTNE